MSDPPNKSSTLLGEAFLETIRKAVREEIEAAVGKSEKKITLQEPFERRPYLSLQEAADLARLAPSTIRLNIRKGKLRAYKEGRRVIIKRADLEKFLETYPTGCFVP